MIRNNIHKFMPKLGLFQSQTTLVDLLLEDLAGILIIHEFPHSRGHKSLVGEMLVFTSFSIFIAFCIFCSFRCCFVIFVFSVKGSIMQDWIVHKLFLNHLHSSHNWSWITFFDNINPISCKINLLNSFFTVGLLFALSCRFCWLSRSPGDPILIHDTQSSLGILAAGEHRISLSLNSLYHFDSFCRLLLRVLNHCFKSIDYRKDVIWSSKGYVHLIFWCSPTPELSVLLRKTKRLEKTIYYNLQDPIPLACYDLQQ